MRGWPFAPLDRTGSGYLLAILTLGALLSLGARHWAIRYEAFITVGILIPYAGFALLVFLLARDRGTRRTVLLLDLATWIVPVTVLLQATRGPVNARFWLASMVVMKIGLLLFMVARAITQCRVTDSWAGWLVCAVAILFFVVPLPFTRVGFKLKGDEPHYLMATVSLLGDGDLFLDDEYRARAYAAFYDGDLKDRHVVPARNGHEGPLHDVGLSILAMVPYQLGGWTLVLVGIAVLAGLVLREIFSAARSLGADSSVALAAAVLVGFSPPFAVFATQVYPEIPAALATIFAVRQMTVASGRRHAPVVVGLSLAVLPWLHFRFWALVLPLVLASLLIWPHRRTIAAVCLPVALSSAVYLLLIHSVYGRLAPTPFLLQPGLSRGATGLGPGALMLAQARPWLDSYDGLLLLAPIYLYALATLPSLLTIPGWIGRTLIVTVTGYSTVIALWYLHSTAGDSPPGRFMVVVLPLLGVALARQMQRQSRRFNLGLTIPLAAVGVISTLVSLSEPLLARYPYGGRGGPIAILSGLVGIQPSGFLPDFSRPSPESFVRATLALALVGVLARLLYRPAAVPASGRRPSGRRRQRIDG